MPNQCSHSGGARDWLRSVLAIGARLAIVRSLPIFLHLKARNLLAHRRIIGIHDVKHGADLISPRERHSDATSQPSDAERLKAVAVRTQQVLSANAEQMRKVADSMKTSSEIIAAARDLLSQHPRAQAAPGAGRFAMHEPAAGASRSNSSSRAQHSRNNAVHRAEVLQLASFRAAKESERQKSGSRCSPA